MCDNYDIILKKLNSIVEAQSAVNQPPAEYVEIDSRISIIIVLSNQFLEYIAQMSLKNITLHSKQVTIIVPTYYILPGPYSVFSVPTPDFLLAVTLLWSSVLNLLSISVQSWASCDCF